MSRWHLSWDSARRYWLIIVLVIALPATILVGGLFYAHGSAPALDLNSMPAPPRLAVFVSNPAAKVALKVVLSPHGIPAAAQTKSAALSSGQWLGQIYISVTAPRLSAPVQWLVQIQRAADDAFRLPVANPPPSAASQIDVYEGETSPTAPTVATPYVGEFVTHPVRVIRGSAVAVLPDLSPPAPLSTSPLQFGIEDSVHLAGPAAGPEPAPILPAGRRPLAISPGPTLVRQSYVYPNRAGQVTRLYPGDTMTRYYRPRSVADFETLAVPLTDYQLTAYPTTPVAQAASVGWSGTGELAPSFTALGLGVADARAKDSFIAGLAFATAAAIAIALLQELHAVFNAGEASARELRWRIWAQRRATAGGSASTAEAPPITADVAPN